MGCSEIGDSLEINDLNFPVYDEAINNIVFECMDRTTEKKRKRKLKEIHIFSLYGFSMVTACRNPTTSNFYFNFFPLVYYDLVFLFK